MCVFGLICLTGMQPKTRTESACTAPHSHTQSQPASPPHLASSSNMLVSTHARSYTSKLNRYRFSFQLFDTWQFKKFKVSTIITQIFSCNSDLVKYITHMWLNQCDFNKTVRKWRKMSTQVPFGCCYTCILYECIDFDKISLERISRLRNEEIPTKKKFIHVINLSVVSTR